MGLVFGFTDGFCSGNRLLGYHFSAAYEVQMWWKQNQLLRYLDKLNNFSSGANVLPMQGDLTFQGANLEAGLDF